MEATGTSETSIPLPGSGKTKEQNRHEEVLQTEAEATNDYKNISCYISAKQGCPFRVGIETGYGLDGRGSITGRGKIVLISVTSKTSSGACPASCPIRTGWISPRREADHSSPTSAEVKNGGAIPPLPHMSSWCDGDDRYQTEFSSYYAVLPGNLFAHCLVDMTCQVFQSYRNDISNF
jgi:hypothetical protein